MASYTLALRQAQGEGESFQVPDLILSLSKDELISVILYLALKQRVIVGGGRQGGTCQMADLGVKLYVRILEL